MPCALDLDMPKRFAMSDVLTPAEWAARIISTSASLIFACACLDPFIVRPLAFLSAMLSE